MGVSPPIEVKEGTDTEGINYEKKGNRIRLAMLTSLRTTHIHKHTKTCPSRDLDAMNAAMHQRAKTKGQRKLKVKKRLESNS